MREYENKCCAEVNIDYWLTSNVNKTYICENDENCVKSLESPNSKVLLFYLNVNDSFNLNSFWIATVMERSFITVNGLPAKFISLGDGIEAKPKKIILIIPGKVLKFIFLYDVNDYQIFSIWSDGFSFNSSIHLHH